MTEAQFALVPFTDIAGDVRSHLISLPSACDSFQEEHIRDATAYRIMVDGQSAGFASIHGRNLITQFSLRTEFKHLGQEIYRRLRIMEHVESAFVSTSDQYFLAHATDDFRQFNHQAYAFAVAESRIRGDHGPFTLRRAELSDVELVRANSGAFFGDIDRHIADGDLYVTANSGQTVAFGLKDVSRIYPDVASIGMFAIEEHRGSGAGTATIALLIDEVRELGLRPVAGCWYYNHASKRTLEKAGMYASSRLLKIDY